VILGVFILHLFNTHAGRAKHGLFELFGLSPLCFDSCFQDFYFGNRTGVLRGVLGGGSLFKEYTDGNIRRCEKKESSTGKSIAVPKSLVIIAF